MLGPCGDFRPLPFRQLPVTLDLYLPGLTVACELGFFSVKLRKTLLSWDSYRCTQLISSFSMANSLCGGQFSRIAPSRTSCIVRLLILQGSDDCSGETVGLGHLNGILYSLCFGRSGGIAVKSGPF